MFIGKWLWLYSKTITLLLLFFRYCHADFECARGEEGGMNEGGCIVSSYLPSRCHTLPSNIEVARVGYLSSCTDDALRGSLGHKFYFYFTSPYGPEHTSARDYTLATKEQKGKRIKQEKATMMGRKREREKYIYIHIRENLYTEASKANPLDVDDARYPPKLVHTQLQRHAREGVPSASSPLTSVWRQVWRWTLSRSVCLAINPLDVDQQCCRVLINKYYKIKKYIKFVAVFFFFFLL